MVAKPTAGGYAIAELNKSGKFPRNNLTGQRFGRLVVKEWVGRKVNVGHCLWDCECECGLTKIIYASSLLRGRTVSCGCFSSENRSKHGMNSTKHGMTRTKVYRAWVAMKTRCYNVKSLKWKHYGGRAITVFQGWIDSFELFYADVGDPPSSKHSLDRIDNNLGYYPGNVKWSTDGEQANNKRNNRLITFNGETKNVSEFARIFNLKPITLTTRLDNGWSVEKALTTPVNHSCYHPRKKVA